MDVLVEVHDERETELALKAGSQLIGINNRNLKDFSMDIETTFRLKKYIPEDIPVVSESGLKTAEDFRRLRDEGISCGLGWRDPDAGWSRQFSAAVFAQQ